MEKYKLKNPIVPMEVMQLNKDNLDDVCDFIAEHNWDIGCRDYEDITIVVIDYIGHNHLMKMGDYIVWHKMSKKLSLFTKKRFESIYERVE